MDIILNSLKHCSAAGEKKKKGSKEVRVEESESSLQEMTAALVAAQAILPTLARSIIMRVFGKAISQYLEMTTCDGLGLL